MDNISIDSPAPVVSEEMQKLVRALTTAIEDGATKRAIDVAHHSLLLAISKIESPSSFVDTGIPENIAEGIAHCRTWYDPTYERISEKECVVFLADRVATLERQAAEHEKDVWCECGNPNAVQCYDCIHFECKAKAESPTPPTPRQEEAV